MALSAYVGSFSTGTGAVSSTVAVTGVGFQPEALFFWWSGRTDTADATSRATYRRGFGAATSPTARWAVTSMTVDASASIASGRAQRNDAIVATAQDSPSGVDALLDLQSMDSDGFTCIVDDVFPSSYTVSFLALGGASLTNAAVGNVLLGTTTGNKAVTGVGFQPDALLFASAGLTTAPPSSSASRSNMMLGLAVSSTQRGVWYGGNGAEAAATSNAGVYCTDAECMAFINDTVTSTVFRADFVSMDSDGFTYNITETDAAARYIWYLALKGGNYAAGSVTTQTDTTTPIAVSGLGFQPTAALFASHMLAESASDTMQNDDRLSVGAASSASQRRALATLDEDNLADTEVTTAVEFDEVYINISAASAVQGLMDVQSFDSGGFTCIMDDADPVGAFVLYFAVGPAAVAAADRLAFTAVVGADMFSLMEV